VTAAATQGVDANSTCQVQLRLPDGCTIREDFGGTQTLREVQDLAKHKLLRTGCYEDFRLVLPPRQVVTDDQLQLTLHEMGLLPRVSFTIQLNSTEGLVTSAPKAGEEFSAGFVNEVREFLKREGFISWEVEQWTELVAGQVNRGEMHRLRRTVKAIFGGRKLTGTIRAWADRVDKAPKFPQPAPPRDPALRMVREYQDHTALERDALGFRVKRLPGDKGLLRVYLHKLPPQSGLELDVKTLSQETALPAEFVFEIKFADDYPFQAPLIRAVFPSMLAIHSGDTVSATSGTSEENQGSGEQDAKAALDFMSLDMSLQCGASSSGLAGARASKWSMDYGSSLMRVIGWTRNWIIGSGVRVDMERSKAIHGLSLRTAAGVWRHCSVQEDVSEDAGRSQGVILPASAEREDPYVEVIEADTKEQDNSGEQLSQSEQEESSAMEVEETEQLDSSERPGIIAVEISTDAGRVSYEKIKGYTSAEGSVMLPQQCISKVQASVGESVVVRLVKVPCANEVMARCSQASLVNFLRFNKDEVVTKLRETCPVATIGEERVILVDGRGIPLQFVVAQPSHIFSLSPSTAVTLDGL